MVSNKSLLMAVAISFVATGLWAQGMKKMDMNDMPFAKVKENMSDPAKKAKARQMANKNGVVLMGGMPVKGQSVTLKGELTGANCYLSGNFHGHDHALCSKACVAAGSPIVFVAENGEVYTVLTGKAGTPLPTAALDNLGRPGVTVKGALVKSHGGEAIAINSVQL